jgi:hypothetical protein
MDSVQCPRQGDLGMITTQEVGSNANGGLLDALPKARTWRRTLVVVNGSPDEVTCSLAIALAQRDGTSLILYDATADSFWASPFPPGEGIRPVLLAEGDLRRVGRYELADALRTTRGRGVNVMAHISTSRHGEDLAALVSSEQIDLVLCPISLDHKFQREIHRSRQQGASLLECRPGEAPVFHAALRADEALPYAEHVQLRFLAALVMTFLVAGFRNRSHL